MMIGRRPELCGFVGQRRSTHVLTVVGGIALFASAYLAMASIQPWTAGAAVDVNQPGPAVRRRALAAGAIVCWTYFALVTMIARGGPLLNTVFYPGAIVAIGPPVIHWIGTGTLNSGVASVAPLYSGRWVVETLAVVVPGMVVCAILLGGWFYGHLDATGRQRWIRRNLPDGFREEFLPATRPSLEETAARTGEGRAERIGPDCRDR